MTTTTGPVPPFWRSWLHMVGLRVHDVQSVTPPLSEGCQRGETRMTSPSCPSSRESQLRGPHPPDVKMNKLVPPRWWSVRARRLDGRRPPRPSRSARTEGTTCSSHTCDRRKCKNRRQRGFVVELFTSRYADVFTPPRDERALRPSRERAFAWDDESTYVRKPPSFDDSPRAAPVDDIEGARVLAKLGDRSRPPHFPRRIDQGRLAAGRYLTSRRRAA